MNKIVVITGLTGSGKSSLACFFAEKYNGEIVSVDSVQIYKGLNIGSAKESIETRQKIQHHLIDIKDFTETYNVSEFITDCLNAINNIIARNKLPILVGGTGLYIKALLQGYSLGSASNEEFRALKQQEAQENGNMFVWEQLNKLNPEKAALVHPNNLKRVIRYLENETFGNLPSITSKPLDGFDVCSIGLIEDRESIYAKINTRVDQMLKEGLQAEVENLIKLGAKREHQAMNSIGYKEWFDYYENKTHFNTTISLIKQHTRNYCKRQLTFLKTIPELTLCSVEQAKQKIEEFLNDNN